MNKKSLSERDICTKYITPALEKAGWDPLTQFLEEFPLTKGRVVVRGQLHTRVKNAWKVPVTEIVGRNYNLDFKNPHVIDVAHGDPDELMKEYEEISKQLVATRDMLKKELMQALGGGK